VGDGNNNVIGPFKNALLSQSHGKKIIPLCFGAFGEVNEDLDKVTQCLAREAASTEEGLTISPLVNTDRKERKYALCTTIQMSYCSNGCKQTQSTYSPLTTLCQGGTEQEAKSER
jgi:hypothetical protein